MKALEKHVDIEGVRSVIAELLHIESPTLNKVSGALGISPRTLQRRIARCGQSFTKLVDEIRFIKARQLIVKGEKLADVALQLGYSDPGSFTRAFERWIGISPQRYKKQFCLLPTAKKNKANN